MNKIPNQRLLKWQEKGFEYIIVRGPDGNGYWIESYEIGKSGKSECPDLRLPYAEDDVKIEFEKQGKSWRSE